jgi:hypothetical protein
MKRKLLTLCCLSFAFAAYSQSKDQIKISGIIRSNTSPLKAALITLYTGEGIAQRTTITNEKGSFNMIVPLGNYHLVAALDGYKAEERTLFLSTKQQPQTTIKPITLKNNIRR